MARRTRGHGRFVRPPAKTKIWIGASVAVGTVPTNSKTLVSELNAAALALRPFTILRTRVSINFRSDQQAAQESPTGAYGKIVVKEIAVNIGATAVPGPVTEPNADWFVYQGMSAPFLFVTAAGFESAGGFRYEIDSKAMRKVDPTDDVVTMFEMRNVGGGFLNIEGRTLIQLH